MKKALFIIYLCFIVLFPFSVSAQQIILGDNQPYGIPAFRNPNATVGNIVSNFLLIMYILGGLAVLIFLIWGAFDWITAGGDKEKISGARRKIVNAFIGLTLLALAWFLVVLVGQVVGFNLLNTRPLPRLDDAPTTTTAPAAPAP